MKRLKKYLILIAIGCACVPLIGIWRGLYSAEEAKDVLRALCDCFTIPAVMLIGVGLILFCSNGGAFDMLSYGVQSLWYVLRSDEKRKQRPSFTEYREKRQSKRAEFIPYLIVGCSFLVVALILLLCYNNV